MKKQKIMIVDDNKVFRQGLKLVLKRFSNFEVIDEAHDGLEFLEKCKALMPDVVLMDIKMPKVDGLTATRISLRYWPEIKIIGFSMYKEKEFVQEMIEAGAKGFLFKESFEHELGLALNKVAEGDYYYSEIINEIL